MVWCDGEDGFIYVVDKWVRVNDNACMVIHKYHR
jgi:hypothetical protein